MRLGGCLVLDHSRPLASSALFPKKKRPECASLPVAVLSHSISFCEPAQERLLILTRRSRSHAPEDAGYMGEPSDVKAKPPVAPGDSRKPSAAETAWERKTLEPTLAKSPERQKEFTTTSLYPIRRLYTEADLAGWDPARDLSIPGEPPLTHGIHASMYRSRLWTMRQFAGFGTAEDTNQRFRYLLAHGQTGLSTAFDLPTLMGYDSDHPFSEGEVGREGVAVDTLADVEALYDGIDLENISVSMTINPSAWILLAMYVAMAKKRGLDLNRLSGTIQADILKEYMAQKEYCFPIGPSVRICRDCITYCAENMRRYNPINISGYHISEAGASPLQEAAFTLANGIVYV